MQIKVYGLLAGSIVLTGLLSACSPNPMVLPERVYGSTAIPAAPPATPVTVVPRTPAAPRPPVMVTPNARTEAVVIPDTSVTFSNKKPPKPKAPVPKIPAPTETPVQQVPATPPTPRVYQASPAVQALMRQADTEAASGSLTKAAETIERALRIEADNPALWLRLSKLNEQQGNQQQAASMAEKAKYYQELLN